MVIDTLTAPMHAAAFIAAIRKRHRQAVPHVINTHHHGDHVNGNQYFEGAEIVGHPYCRDEVVEDRGAGGPAFWAEARRLGGRHRAAADRPASHDVRRRR